MTSVAFATESNTLLEGGDDETRIHLENDHDYIKNGGLTNNWMEVPLLEKYFCEENLPSHVTVSTMSITFRLSLESIDIATVCSDCILSTDAICSTDYKGVLCKAVGYEGKKPKKRKSHNFYNSMTLEVSVGQPKKVMHFKLFKNGSIQGAGCQSINQGNYAIRALVSTLQQVCGCTLDIRDLKINLINVNFKISHCVNRDNLHRLLKSIGIITTYEKCKHAGVGVKFLPPQKEKPISIFVFESGSIVITGSKNDDHINEGYRFITSLIEDYKSEVFKLKSADALQRALAIPKYAKLLVSVDQKG